MAERIIRELPPAPGNPRNSEGDFARLPDGRIIFAYSRFTGGADDGDGCDIAAIFSDDGGLSFGEPEIIVSAAADHGVGNIMSVSFLPLSDGPGLFYLVKAADGSSSYVLRRYAGEGRFGEPSVCFPGRFKSYFVVNNCRLLRTAGGRILIPAASHRYCENDMDGRAVSYIYASDDDGRSFYEQDTCLCISGRTRSGLQEPGLWELPGGGLAACFRTDRLCHYISLSPDGEHWSDPQPWPQFSAPCSPLKIARSPFTGEYFAVWNPDPLKPSRTPLAIARSSDGLEFGQLRLIGSEADRSYSYPALFFPEPGKLLLSYCCGGPGDGNGLARTAIKLLDV